MAGTMERTLSDAQTRALEILGKAPLEPGFFNSGWGPVLHGKRSHRVTVTEQTARSLVRAGFARIRTTGNKPKDRLLEITPEGALALARGQA